MKHKFKLATVTSLLCANAYATPVYQPPGPNLTYGSSSNNQSIMSSVANPAAGAAVLSKEDGQYRFGILSIGGGYEVGNVNNLANQIDATNAKLNNQTIPPSVLAGTDAEIVNYVNSQVVAPVNSLTNTLQQDGNASVYFGGHVPFTPFVISKKKLGGSFVLDANVSAIANGTFIANPFADITTAEVAAIRSGGTYTPPTNDSTLLVKAAMVSELGLGYSRSILTRAVGDPTVGEMTSDKLKAGELTAGVRLKYYQVKLANKAQRQQSTTAGGAQSTLKASQTYSSRSGVGLDVGTLWTSRRYRVGAWVSNLNKPSFKYNAVDLTGYTNAGVISQLSGTTTYEMKPQLQLEGAVFSESQNWVINGGLDANAVKDAVGRDFQWMTLSAAYATNSWWIPGARVGYRSNRAGSKLSYITGGLTLFKALSLDAALSTNKVTDNGGKSIPRSAMLNLNVQMTF